MQKERILVVDDERGVRESLKEVFKDRYFVFTASSGEEAIERVKKDSPDLIILDQRLPGINGIDVLRILRKFRYTVPVIMLSVVQTVRTVIEVMKLGVCDFISKPFDVDEIISSVELALASPRIRTSIGEELSTIVDLATEMISEIDLHHLLSHIMDIATQLIAADTSSLMLLDEEGKRLNLRATKGMDDRLFKDISVKVGEGIAGWVVEKGEPLLLVNGLKHYPQFANLEGKGEIKSAICVPLKSRRQTLGVLNLNRIMSEFNFTRHDLELACLLANHATIAIENARLHKDLEAGYLEIISSLAAAIDAKDPHTHGHSQRVAEYARLIAKALGYTQQDLEVLEQAALLHDIGKIGVPEEILSKTEKLTDEDWEKIKRHPLVGKEILSPLKALEKAIPIIYYHHERYDGQGYLEGIKGEAIPLGARILTLSDSLEAMFSDRPYRPRLPFDSIIEEVTQGSGTQFDPKVVDVFFSILERDKEALLCISGNISKNE